MIAADDDRERRLHILRESEIDLQVALSDATAEICTRQAEVSELLDALAHVRDEIAILEAGW